MTDKPTSRRSGRVMVDKNGTRERIDVDTAKDADNSRALHYDTAPGKSFNDRKRAGKSAPALKQRSGAASGEAS